MTLAPEPVTGSPELYLWGCEVTDLSLRSSPELAHALNTLEPKHRQQTEPDIMLRIPGWGWIVIEAKLNSGLPMIADSAKAPDAVEAWIARYADACPEAIDAAALRSADPKHVPGRSCGTSPSPAACAPRASTRTSSLLFPPRRRTTRPRSPSASWPGRSRSAR